MLDSENDQSHYIKIEVSYALLDKQVILTEKISPDTTIEEAIHLSGVLEQFPEIDLSNNKVGVFGKLRKLDSTLLENDRIEIYRPLLVDPKESRRKRAAKKEKVKSEQHTE
jgi:putative ubiquitin-RnfH superfamily antitoxin RatB of RatAB toxin-antitoxin module